MRPRILVIYYGSIGVSNMQYMVQSYVIVLSIVLLCIVLVYIMDSMDIIWLIMYLTTPNEVNKDL